MKKLKVHHVKSLNFLDKDIFVIVYSGKEKYLDIDAKHLIYSYISGTIPSTLIKLQENINCLNYNSFDVLPKLLAVILRLLQYLLYLLVFLGKNRFFQVR